MYNKVVVFPVLQRQRLDISGRLTIRDSQNMWSTAKSDVNDSFPTQWLNLSWLQAAMRIACIQQMFWRIKCRDYSQSSFKHDHLMYLNLVPRNKKPKKTTNNLQSKMLWWYFCAALLMGGYLSPCTNIMDVFLSGSSISDLNLNLHQCCCRVSSLF